MWWACFERRGLFSLDSRDALNWRETCFLSISFPMVYASLMAQLVKSLPAMWETWVQSLGWEDPLEKGIATHSSILAWRIPWTIPGGYEESDKRVVFFPFSFLWYISQSSLLAKRAVQCGGRGWRVRFSIWLWRHSLPNKLGCFPLQGEVKIFVMSW